MSSTTFTPRVGSKPAALAAFFQENPGASLTTEQLVSDFGIPAKSINVTLKRSISAGLIHKADDDGATVWRSGPEPEIEAEPQPFCAALDSDGELFLRGVQVMDEATGDVLLNKENVTALLKYLSTFKSEVAS